VIPRRSTAPQDPPGIRPGGGLGDPPQIGEGTEIPVEIEGTPGPVKVGVVGDPSSTRTVSPKDIKANGGKIPLPEGARAGQVVFVTMTEPPFSSFLIEVVGSV
jgi:hypothetical protein